MVKRLKTGLRTSRTIDRAAKFSWGDNQSAKGAGRAEENVNINFFLLPTKFLQPVTSQPSYLNNLITVQPPRITRSSSVVTLSRPPTISSLKITDLSFRYASPRLWNQLPDSFRQPRQSRLDLPTTLICIITRAIDLIYGSDHHHSHHPSLFHSMLKTYLFNKSFPP